ncbi:hypothetical protein SS50377_23046 [Spironucleus salmonicida]|uniref:Uncharacterized protein n=1 Tax=Spironucleus salmonicida TaxID=348837 RepID=V6LTP7_9EUKA|nr:hypothetical protein SS50377_23046 [Spironucleus salmonicida]|eukprot:EST47623.1 Hypothetical protein SS50377_fx048 [Spironucleus salmonicida]
MFIFITLQTHLSAGAYRALIGSQAEFGIFYTIGTPTKQLKKRIFMLDKKFQATLSFHSVSCASIHCETPNQFALFGPETQQKLVDFSKIESFVLENLDSFKGAEFLKDAIIFSESDAVLIVQAPLTLKALVLLRQLGVQGVLVTGNEKELKGVEIEFQIGLYYIIRKGKSYKFDGPESESAEWGRSVLRGQEYEGGMQEL